MSSTQATAGNRGGNRGHTKAKTGAAEKTGAENRTKNRATPTGGEIGMIGGKIGAGKIGATLTNLSQNF